MINGRGIVVIVVSVGSIVVIVLSDGSIVVVVLSIRLIVVIVACWANCGHYDECGIAINEEIRRTA